MIKGRVTESSVVVRLAMPRHTFDDVVKLFNKLGSNDTLSWSERELIADIQVAMMNR